MRTNRPVYLDNQATTPCDPRVVAAMVPWFTEEFGNPHSLEHALGRTAEAAVEVARAHVADLIGAEPREIVFTSGATEANNLAIKGAARFAAARATPKDGLSRRRIITLATEHKCVLESVEDLAGEGFEPKVLPVRGDGSLDLSALAAALATPTLLVSIMAVNNETGLVHDIATMAELARAAGALFHTDAAQAAGKIAIDVRAWKVDLLSLSGHKMYGPKGVGALYIRRRPRVRLMPLFSGGGQERGMRPGTLPTPLIVALGEASRLAATDLQSDSGRIGSLRDRLLSALQQGIPGLVVNGAWHPRVPGNLNLTFPDTSAAFLMAENPDLCVSTGSACSSASIEPSYVLRALGLSPAAAARSLRIGIGRFTSEADVEFAAKALVVSHQSATVGA